MKKAIMFAILLAFTASMCFAAEAGKKSETKDPITATAEFAGKTAVAPVEAVFGGKKEAKKEAKETEKAMKETEKEAKKVAK